MQSDTDSIDEHLHTIRDGRVDDEATIAPSLLMQSTAMLGAVVAASIELLQPGCHRSDRLLESVLTQLRYVLCIDSLMSIHWDRYGRVSGVHIASADRCTFDGIRLLGKPLTVTGTLQQRFKRRQLLEARDVLTVKEVGPHLASLWKDAGLNSWLIGGVLTVDEVSGLIIAGSTRRHYHWDIETHLVLKLITAAYSSGHLRSRDGEMQ